MFAFCYEKQPDDQVAAHVATQLAAQLRPAALHSLGA